MQYRHSEYEWTLLSLNQLRSMAGKRISHARHTPQQDCKRQASPQQDAQSITEYGWRVDITDQKMVAVFDREAGLEPNIVNLTRWKQIGAAAPIFAQAYCLAFRYDARSTRSSSANNFISGFVKFARENQIEINSPNDVPEGIGNAFVEFLDAIEDGKKRFSINTQLNYHKTYKKVAEALHKLDSAWKRLSVAHQPFAGKPAFSMPKEDPTERLGVVMTAAAKQAKETMDDVWTSLPRLHEELAALTDRGKPRTSSPEAKVAWILDEFGGNYPLLKTVRTLPGLRDMKEDEYVELRRIAHPIGIDLVPFFLLLSMHTGFNEQTLRELTLSGIVPIEFLGEARLLIKSSKRRAGPSKIGAPQRRAIPASDYELAPERLIQFLRDWTARIRSFAIPQIQDDLFMHVTSEGGKNNRRGLRVDSYAGINDNYNTKVANFIMKFCEVRNIKYSATRDSRLAFSNLIDELSGGDALELKRLLGHKRISTGQDSYQTWEMQKRGAEKLAGAIAAHQRFINSGGKIDSRRSTTQHDRTAATPGFICADVFQSPQFGEREGRMCASYGKCPACPLAASDANKAYALARFLQLKELYESSIGELGIEIWKSKFSDSYEALTTKWIPAVDSEKNREAASRVVLATLPSLE